MTRISPYLSTVMPGRKSASPKITRQAKVSMTAFRYFQAAFTRSYRKAGVMTSPSLRERIRTRMVDFRLMTP